MREVDRLRAEAKRLRRNATAKVGRIRRNYGVDLSGSNNDPRRDNSTIDRMDSRQLKTLIRNTSKFLDRNTGFVAGAKGVVIPINVWRDYKRVETRFNAKADAHRAQFADMVIPGSTMTVQERDEDIRNRRSKRGMSSDASNRPLERVDRQSTNMRSERAVRKLTRDLERRMNPTFYKKAMSAARKQANTMASGVGSPELKKFVGGLSDEEFDFLWFYGKLAHDLSARYDSDQDASRIDVGFQNVKERAEADILEEGGWQDMFDKFRRGEK